MSVTLPILKTATAPPPDIHRQREGALMALAVMFVLLLISLPGAWKIVVLLPIIIIGGYWLNKAVQQPNEEVSDTVLFSSSCIVISDKSSFKRYDIADVRHINLYADLVFIRKPAAIYGPIKLTITLKDGTLIDETCAMQTPMQYTDMVYALKAWYKSGLSISETMRAENLPALLLRTEAFYSARNLQQTKSELGIS